MPNTFRFVVLAICAALATVQITAADEAIESVEIELGEIEAKSVLTVLRTMAGIKHVEVVDENTLRVTDTAEKVTLVENVLALLDPADGTASHGGYFDVGDGTLVAAVELPAETARSVMAALRVELKIQKLAIVDDLSLLLIRDVPEQVEAALELIRSVG